jgi:hypothetical protein
MTVTVNLGQVLTGISSLTMRPAGWITIGKGTDEGNTAPDQATTSMDLLSSSLTHEKDKGYCQSGPLKEHF